MRLFGFEITRAKALESVSENRGWWHLISEPFAGAWQRNKEKDQSLALSFHAVFACITLIASDISKLRIKLLRLRSGVWQEDKSPSFDPVLRKPNRYQTRSQFIENWVLSRLMRGNAYILKDRDKRGVVSAMHVLDPNRVQTLVTESGDVFYQMQSDNLTGLTKESRIVPASEIIHDRVNTFFHPLVGLSPLYAAALAAVQGLNIQNNATEFFGNKSIPGGIITTPHTVKDEHLKRIKEAWETGYSGKSAGKTAVLSDGMEFKPMAVTATDAQLLEQARATAEWVCSAFHVPPYKIGIGQMPTYNNVQALNVEYYSQCLQSILESIEAGLDEGLSLPADIGVEFDLDGLLRMDTVSQISSLKEASSAGLIAPNEGRAKLGLKPVEGGDSPMVQQQFFSLEALAERDREKPFAKPAAPSPAAQATSQNEDEEDDGGERPDTRERSAKIVQILKRKAAEISRAA